MYFQNLLILLHECLTLNEPRHEISNNVVCSIFYYIELLTEHHLEFLRLIGGDTGSSESIHVKMPHCRKLHVAAELQ